MIRLPHVTAALALLSGALLTVASAQSEPKHLGSAIPARASPNCGWQTNVADWQDPPAGHGHGPIATDPAHPFLSNADAARTNAQPTLRIGNSKDPVLKPWAAKLMADSNEDALGCIRQVPFAA